MTAIGPRARSAIAGLTIGAGLIANVAVCASSTCPDEQKTPQTPKDLALCGKLEPFVRKPSELPLDVYEKKLGEFLGAMCHRRSDWKVDKWVRDTGPWVGTYRNGKWIGQYYGTHAPALVWYSPDFYAWLRANRPEENRPDSVAPVPERPVPDGAIMIKEMYPPPATACAGVDTLHLLAKTKGAAVMVRDSKGSYDGWFWGWYGWGPEAESGWYVDWPARPNSPYPNMGFGQYCTNCHASAKANQTFAALRNIKGEPNIPPVYLSQNFFLDPSWRGLHSRILQSAAKDAAALGAATPAYDSEFEKTFWLHGGRPRKAVPMPAETYDNVWVKPGQPTAASQFVTSDQCLGCHSAGGTGVQFDMTEPGTDSKLINISPYGTWRGSPMGLAGRDPIFFAQLASETDTFHRDYSSMIQDTCLACHGIMGQRQFAIDTREETGACGKFSRATVAAKPDSPHDAKLARYGALARDGISCTACHRMVLGNENTAKYRNDPQNKCVDERQAALNPDLTGFAKTFTGNFLVGPPDRVFGPFQKPKPKSMKNALGIEPEHDRNIMRSEACGSCHTVRLPIRHRGQPIGHTYEQTTYPEWAFSDYRTGDSPDGRLPSGAGPRAQSCQDCHMPNKDADGNPYRSKIAAIQEHGNFPQAEHTLPPGDIDLPVRSPFGKHTLVGLNVFLLKMAWQFPEVLGIRREDPMLSDGIESIPTVENAMLDQAVNRTASISIGDVKNDGSTLDARVTVISRVGHKFPSGVGFRRAFLELKVLDADNKELWVSGRTNGVGVIVDENREPIDGELWWKDDCSARIDPDKRIHQPHYQEITRQNQAQIYQELLAAPPDVPAPQCGAHARPEGPLTTSFFSICSKVKDNRLLPHGFLGLDERKEIATKLGAGPDLAEDTDPVGVSDDPDYRTGGGDSLVYRVPLAELGGKPAALQATLYYQPTPPFFLQDRFCTSDGDDTKRLYYLAGKLDLAGTPAQDWKLRVVTSGPVPAP